MKYIKQYENKLDIKNFKNGDYVICEEKTNMADINLVNFINSNIGQILNSKELDDSWDTLYEVRYENIPDELKMTDHFHVKYTYYIRNFYQKEIVHFSEKRETLELILSANKYNL